MSENGNNSGNSEGNNEMDGNSSREKVPQEPAIVYNNIDVETELESLVKLLDGKIYKEEEIAMEELHQYLIEDDGCWALSDNFLTFVGRVLRDAAFSSTTRVHLIRILAYAALKDDVIILLHQDRRDHTLMNFANDFDKHSPEEQQAWGIFICNLFANPSPSEWLLYISEWENNNQTLSNIRITTKVTVHCVLSSCPTLKNIGTSILFNLAIKEVKTVVFDDVAVEVAMAILQFFTSSPNEEQVFKALKALVRFMEVSNDVGQFIQMIGPHPKMFAGMSERVDELVNFVTSKVPV
ncbi:uncharacterized protein LOC129913717 [Episyrphus balteatus]|uniref:uncharacterized protein LOC129913717 n=1 Tax=Episyrphus balteatus TaxID=286459 RepID=UPI0024854A7E|nr:uncharacterized protein LOC129913717 [Episyrphus balteatus]